MTDIHALTAAFPRCLQEFSRDGYAAAFGSYCGDCADFFASLREEDVKNAAEQLMGFAESKLPRRLGRKPMLFDLRSFFCVYLCPAALKHGGASALLAEALADEWNGRYPDFSFEPGRFEDIASGFRTKPFGF